MERGKRLGFRFTATGVSLWPRAYLCCFDDEGSWFWDQSTFVAAVVRGTGGAAIRPNFVLQ